MPLSGAAGAPSPRRGRTHRALRRQHHLPGDRWRAEGRRVVVDADTGIRALWRKFMVEEPGEINLLITHLHWDHLLDFTFFEPVYHPDWRIELGGWPRALKGLAGFFDDRLQDGRFPLAFGDLPAAIRQSGELDGPRFWVGEMLVHTCPLNYPQGGVGLRLEEEGRALVFFTDNELVAFGPGAMDDFACFCAAAAVLVHDAQYLPEKLPQRAGWGAFGLEESAGAGLPGRGGAPHPNPPRPGPQRSPGGRAFGPNADGGPAGLVVDAAGEGMALEL